MTIAAYIRKERVRTAMSMLSENRLSLVEIADTLCFSSLPHFEKIFREVTGVTPGVYRRNLL